MNSSVIEPSMKDQGTLPPEESKMKDVAESGQEESDTVIAIDDLNFAYDGKTDVLRDVSLNVKAGEVTAFIGPSGCGKTTLLRCFNRMNDLIPGAGITKGKIRILGTDIYDPKVDEIELRKHVGMIFQKIIHSQKAYSKTWPMD